MSRYASRVERAEHRAEAIEDHADMIAEARAEAQIGAYEDALAEMQADLDWDGYEAARNEDRYLRAFGWD